VNEYTLPCCGKVIRTLSDLGNTMWFEDEPDRGPECHCGRPSAHHSGACVLCGPCDCATLPRGHNFGEPGCENHDHHCEFCHEKGICTKAECGQLVGVLRRDQA
jgi:hypothetical protein